VSLVECDVLTIDEARADLGRDPLPDGSGVVTLTPYRQRLSQTTRLVPPNGRPLEIEGSLS